MTTDTSPVAKGWSQISTVLLHSKVDEICAQLTNATILPRIYVEQASQFVQQTNTIARQALKRMTTVRAQT